MPAGPMVLEGGLDRKATSYAPAAMDFAETRAQAAREIALSFGVPPMLLGIFGDNTYANYAEANLNFRRQPVLPLAGAALRQRSAPQLRCRCGGRLGASARDAVGQTERGGFPYRQREVGYGRLWTSGGR